MRTPHIPLYLDALLPDEPFTAGEIPMFGSHTMLKEQAAGGEESRLQDDSAIDISDDANRALRELGDDAHSYGYLTTTITV